MKPAGFLNLRAIGGQIAALVIVSIVVLHVIIAAIWAPIPRRLSTRSSLIVSCSGRQPPPPAG